MARSSLYLPGIALGAALLLNGTARTGHAVTRFVPWQQVSGPDGEVRTLYGRDSEPLDGATPEVRAREFLEREAATLGLPGDTSDLELQGVDRSALGDHVHFRQTASGRPVFGGGVSVHLRGDRAYRATTSYRALTLSQPGPALTWADALGRNGGIRQWSLKNDANWSSSLTRPSWRLPVGEVTMDGEPELGVWPLAQETVWAWRARVRDARGLTYDLYADAEVGRRLQLFPRFKHLTAPIYPENPISTPVRSIHEITNVDTSGFLKGPYADVRMNAQIGLRGITGGTRAKAGENGYRFTPGDGRSVLVNAFHHINRVHDYFKGLGVSQADHALPVLLRFRDPLGQTFPNAMYSPDDGEKGLLALGEGPNGEDFGLDSDVLLHEYSHFIIHQVSPNLGNSATLETAGLNEGFCDFFSASLNGNPRVAEFLSPLLDGRDHLRDLSTRRHYPEDTGESGAATAAGGFAGFTESHVLGELIGGAMWDLRNVIGPKAESLLVDALPLLGQTSSFPDVRSALLDADRLRHGGEYGEKIRQVFDARGIDTKAARYLSYDSFTSLRQQAEVFIGPLYGDAGQGEAYVYIDPFMGMSATFVAGRSYSLSGFIADRDATSVSLAVTDAKGKAVDSLAQTQDVTRQAIYSSIHGDAGRGFNLPIRFPGELEGQAVTVALTFKKGLRTTWTASTKVDVVENPGPAVALVPEPETPVRAVLGDITNDRKITTADATAALRMAVGLETGDERLLALDIAPQNPDGTIGDDRVNLLDVGALLKLAVGRLR